MNLQAINKATNGKTKTTGVSSFMEIELSKIFTNPNQPRKKFINIEELATSIGKKGLMQPIVVIKRENGYMIVSGERRYRACKHLNLKSIKSHIVEADGLKIQELALIENIQREDLSSIEKAKFISMLWSSGLYEKKQDLAAAIGKPQSYISKAFKAIKLSDEIIYDIEENKKDIGLEILQELSNVKNKDKQLELYQSGAKRDEIRAAANTAKISPAKKVKHIFEITREDYATVIWEFMDKSPSDKKYKLTIEEV